MKKVFCLFCAFVLCLAAFGAYAESVQPFYLEVQRISVALIISSDGTATCSGAVTAQHNETTTSMTITLKRSSDGKKWSRVTSWNVSGSGLLGATADETYTVSKGYQYKVTVSGKIYDKSGTLLESVSKTSSAKSY